MKFFFFKLCLTIIFTIFTWTVIYNNLEMRMDLGDFSRWKFKLDKMNNNSIEYSNVILGDSAADSGLRSKFFDNKTINLSLGAGSSVDGYYYFVNYLKRHSPPKRLILSYSNLGMLSRPSFYSHTMIFGYFDFLEMIKGDSINNGVYELLQPPLDISFSFLSTNRTNFLTKLIAYWELLTLKTALNIHQLERVSNIFTSNFYSINLRRYNKLYSYPDNYIDVPLKFNKVKSSMVPKKIIVNNTFKYFSEKLVRLALANGVTVYIIPPPLNEIYTEYFNPIIIKDLVSYYYEFTKNLKNVKIDTQVLIYKSEFFDDSLHLNELGAKTFSNYVKDFIQN